jgi:RNA exonuclease 1
MDKLVRPAWPISDMRTGIHGIAIEDIENVTYTLRHAQAEILSFCSNQTIIVGHGIHNDLKALKLNHK